MRGGDERIDILSNASATSAWFPVKVGGTYLWSIEGTFNSGSYQLQLQNANGTATDIAGASRSAAGFMEVDLPPGGMVRAVETGTTSAMYSTLVRMPEGAGIGTFDTEVVVGSVASGATDSGNPVKVGGVYNSTKPTLTNGQRGDLQIGTRGSLFVTLAGNDSTTVPSVAALGDGSSPSSNALIVGSHPLLFNGTNSDRARNNTDITLLASAARTASNDTADQTNYNGRGVHIVIDVTAIAATPSVVFTVQGKDALSGKYYTLLASTAIVGTGTTVLRIFPGATAAANLTANDILPRTWRVSIAHDNADSITYSVGASVIL